jgi:hypothetical protein
VLILAAYSISCLPVPFGFLQVEASAYFGQICSLGSTSVLLRASAPPLVFLLLSPLISQGRAFFFVLQLLVVVLLFDLCVDMAESSLLSLCAGAGSDLFPSARSLSSSWCVRFIRFFSRRVFHSCCRIQSLCQWLVSLC